MRWSGVLGSLRNVAEVGIGALYGIGAVFNTAYTLSHGDEFYGSFSKGAWFGPARWAVDHIVLPNAVVFTVALILFQAAVAIMILSRGDLVAVALFAGAVFSVVAALASSPGGTLANLALAAMQTSLALSR